MFQRVDAGLDGRSPSSPGESSLVRLQQLGPFSPLGLTATVAFAPSGAVCFPWALELVLVLGPRAGMVAAELPLTGGTRPWPARAEP